MFSQGESSVTIWEQLAGLQTKSMQRLRQSATVRQPPWYKFVSDKECYPEADRQTEVEEDLLPWKLALPAPTPRGLACLF